MKKYLGLFLILTSSVSYAIMDDFLGPATSLNTNVTIASPGIGKRNCLDYVAFNSTNSIITAGQATYLILDGQTTSYTIVVATTSAPVINQFDSPLPWCGSFNQSTTMKVTGSSGYQINYIGYVDRAIP